MQQLWHAALGMLEGGKGTSKGYGLLLLAVCGLAIDMPASLQMWEPP